MCFTTDRLKFLDISNYLAPGFSYSKYLATYDVTETKGHFCYEYLTDLTKLDKTSLPPQSAFFSTLKNCGISDDYYALCQKVWVDNNMKTLRDFLVWYNNKDVVPFLAAFEKQVDFYDNLGVDIFKDAISIPGITLRYLFQTLPPTVPFQLFSDNETALHTAIRENIIGGPSIIFHRYHEGRDFNQGW